MIPDYDWTLDLGMRRSAGVRRSTQKVGFLAGQIKVRTASIATKRRAPLLAYVHSELVSIWTKFGSNHGIRGTILQKRSGLSDLARQPRPTRSGDTAVKP
jgi:hypothetical protein